ncbi:MAG: SagB/ThcOx family dehydrogenase [Paludibacteraceae bacterium]
MRKSFLLLLACLLTFSIYAQEAKSIKLKEPGKSRKTDVMQAFQNRQSTNEYQSKDLSLQDLSDLLWAANGINRPQNGKKTAPSAMNSQDIDVYVCRADGVYLYDAAKKELRQVAKKDLRPLMNGNRPNDAPVLLLLVADLSRYKSYVPGNDEANKRLRDMSALDAGIVSQNISILCAAAALGTRPRAGMNQDELRKELSLKQSQILWLNHPVGYTKK